MAPRDHRYLETALRAVDGVADAVVEPDESASGPGVLHLRLADGADEVAVTEEVSRLLRTHFHLAVDADRMQVVGVPAGTPPRHTTSLRAAPPLSSEEPLIAGHREPVARRADPELSVVRGAEPQAAEAAAPQVQPDRRERLSLQQVQVVSKGSRIVATVGLASDGRTFSGEADSAATSRGILRCVAMATLRAVEEAVGGRARFEVDSVEIGITGRDQTALSVVSMVYARGTEQLAGASLVREDVHQAVIRSMLAAVNRRVTQILGEL